MDVLLLNGRFAVLWEFCSTRLENTEIKTLLMKYTNHFVIGQNHRKPECKLLLLRMRSVSPIGETHYANESWNSDALGKPQ